MLRRFFTWLGDWLVGTPIDAAPPILATATPSEETAPAAAPATPPVGPNRRATTARIMAAFDAAHPVRQRHDLQGRDDKLEMLFEAVLYNRQHAIIHGARGSGKTSLAQVFGDYADQQSAVVIYAACEATATFADLLRPYFTFIPDSCVPFAEKAAFERDRQALAGAFGPRDVVDFLSRLSPERQIIMILDEFDRVENAEVDRQVATLMKLLSDAQSPVQVIVVGIAHTLDDLIDCHPSLRRHLVPIPIGRISQADVLALIDKGAARARIAFDETAKQQIAALSCGSPYHTQLFCYVSAIEASRRDRDEVDGEILHHGLRRACEAWGMLNQDDHTRFTTLAGSCEDDVARLEIAAREAASRDSLRPDQATAALLGDALLASNNGERMVFRDCTAPQFLLAMIALERARTNPEAAVEQAADAPDDEDAPASPLAIAV